MGVERRGGNREGEFVSVEGNYLKRFFYYIFSFLFSLFFFWREKDGCILITKRFISVRGCGVSLKH